MSFRGYRKFTAFVLTLVSFTIILFNSPNIDPFALGSSLALILGAFGGSNAYVHVKGK